jgi:hypothetical protein
MHFAAAGKIPTITTMTYFCISYKAPSLRQARAQSANRMG